jgi:NADH-quinone oxidoreductase subunit M
MTWLNSHPLTFLVFAPTLLGCILLALPQAMGRLARMLGFMGALAFFALSLSWLLGHGAGDVIERAPWFTLVGLPVDYALTVDGLNLWLVILTTFLVPLTMLGTWNSLKDRIGTFAALFLLLETGMLGALMAQDLFFFYLFWEAMLIPMYFMIGVWGGDERRYAANKFFLFTLSGSLLWLVALLYLANKASIPCSWVRPRRRCPSMSSAGCSSPSPWPSPSRCRCSRCTPGCRTPTCRRPRRVPSSSPVCC